MEKRPARQMPHVYLSTRFTDAVDYARDQHQNQTRKGSAIPYIYHLLGVASLVLEYGGDEDQVIAGLLHDVIEDCGSKHELIIRERFGDRVADIVLACTDGTEEAKAAATTPQEKYQDWRQRKLAYLERLRQEGADALLVSCCDKLHNARAIVGDMENPDIGVAVFERFTAKRDGTLRYYHAVSEVFAKRRVRAAPALATAVARMHDLADAQMRRGLEQATGE